MLASPAAANVRSSNSTPKDWREILDVNLIGVFSPSACRARDGAEQEGLDRPAPPPLAGIRSGARRRALQREQGRR